ncbi:MAG: hypothetical protein BIFFINMI_01012 [Phycisphaerae bacterium]|nr:hypothetical protein [Phycisphaerae bacterium]
MNRQDEKYTRFALCREMLDAAGVIERFNPGCTDAVINPIKGTGRLFLTGEGSSRIFPAKNAMRKAMAWGTDLQIATDGSRQAATYDLARWVVFAASNSGRTKEVIALLKKLLAQERDRVYGLTANEGTLLGELTSETIVLTCGWENAVAATKSVVEQALVYQAIVSRVAGHDMEADLAGAARAFDSALTMELDDTLVARAAQAPTIYFAGFNDGVAEELTLKTNEITRRKSDYLEGTYAVHGIEEVMDPADVVIVVDPVEAEMAKFKEVLVDGVGMTVIAIADRETIFPTLRVAPAGEMSPFIHLAAGWNLLVEIGLELGIDLDKPQRARKVGNEFTG